MDSLCFFLGFDAVSGVCTDQIPGGVLYCLLKIIATVLSVLPVKCIASVLPVYSVLGEYDARIEINQGAIN